MSQGFASPFLAGQQAPTITSYTSGSGTYTVPAGVQYLIVELVGGGGGGSGSGTGAPGAGGAGGNTTFGSSFLTANGGNGASADVSLGNSGGTGGTASIGVGATGLAVQGGSGGSGGLSNAAGAASAGGMGGVSYLGGAGLGPKPTIAGSAATTNSGSGGGGAGGTGPGVAGGGGGAGGFVQALITSPSSTYAYSIGAGGTAGTAGTSGAAGGAGAAGIIIIYEFYSLLGITGTLNLPLAVDQGGSGRTSATAYGVICGGTTSTGAHQSIASVGTSGQVLTSNGAGALPTFQTVITDWVAYTPTFTGFGTVSNVQIWSRRVGDTLYIRGRFTGGTSTATEARMTLGYAGTNSNVTSSSTKITNIQLAGFACFNAAGNVANTLIESNIGYITFGSQNTGTVGGGLGKLNGNATLGSGTVLSIMAEIPVDTWP